MTPSQISELNVSSFLSNVTSEETETQPNRLSSQYVLFTTIFFAIIAAVGIPGNSLVLAIVARLRETRAPCDLLVANICVADLAICVIAVPLRIIEVYRGWILGEVMCYIIVPLQDVFAAVSAVTHTAIAMFKYHAVATPFHAKMSEKQMKTGIVVTWITCYLATGAPITVFLSYEGDNECRVQFTSASHRTGYILFLVILFIVIPLFIECAAYTGIIYKLRANMVFQPSGFPQSIHSQRLRQTKRLIKMLMVMMLAFNVSWIPRGVIMVMVEFTPQRSTSPHFTKYVSKITLAMFYIKSVINPFILFSMSGRFRSNCFKEFRN